MEVTGIVSAFAAVRQKQTLVPEELIVPRSALARMSDCSGKGGGDTDAHSVRVLRTRLLHAGEIRSREDMTGGG
jgi:hypothetical protein